MRVTSSMYYKNMYGDSNSKLSKELFDVNKQISSGLQIQYAHDNIRTFTETMRLDNEITTLGQAIKSTESAYKFSTQTDSVLNEFTTSLDRTKVLLIQASNSSQSDDSMDAIASELRGLEDHFKNLANTSINGKYIFSGSATSTKPIDSDGLYQGNDITMSAFAGSNVKQDYNLTGKELFLGENTLINKEITANVVHNSLTAKYPDFTDTTKLGVEKAITEDSTIRDLMGDNDNDTTNSYGSHFYLNGVDSTGKSFNTRIDMGPSGKVSDLLKKIGDNYGNTPAVDVVNVSLNEFGEIVIEDKMNGSSKIDFNMIGAIDYNTASSVGLDGTDAGLVTNISDLGVGDTDFNAIINGTSTAANKDLYIKNFVLSNQSNEFHDAKYTVNPDVVSGDTLSISVTNRDGTITQYTQDFDTDASTTYDKLASQIGGDFTATSDSTSVTVTTSDQGLANGAYVNEGLKNNNSSASITTAENKIPIYDKMYFEKNGAELTSSVPQILKDTNAFATPLTKISEVANLVSGATGTLDGEQFTLSGLTTSGDAFTAQIDFNSTANGGSTFSLDGGSTNYDIFNTESTRVAVDADKMTYQQLMDVVNMVVTDSIPTLNTSADYDAKIQSSQFYSATTLSYDGKIKFEDLQSTNTKASIALYDSNAGDFTKPASVMTFNSNNALTVRDPKTDFFKNLDDIIKSIENHERYPDSSSGDVRNIGIENAISMVDDLARHVERSHAIVGSQSTSITNARERSELLEISTITLRSETINTDLAEASLTLTQLQLNYQAMLSTVGKVSQLSLVNYL